MSARPDTGLAARCCSLRGTPGVWWGLVLLLVSACASTPRAPAGKPDLLQFLDQPGVTLEQVIARLGPPSARFIRDNVVTYRLGRNETGYFVVPPSTKRSELGWEGVDYDLVLAFNADETLRQHSLVAIRSTPAKPAPAKPAPAKP